MTAPGDKSIDPSGRGTRVLLASFSLLLLLASGVAVAHTVRTVREKESVFTTTGLTPFADAAEASRRMYDVVGNFATGSAPGDRVIAIDSRGAVRFSIVGPLEAAYQSSDSFKLALRGKIVCLATRSSGVIEMPDIDQLTYFDDVYRRTK